MNVIPNNPEEAKLDLFFDNKSVSYLGIGVTLYFEYIKIAIIVIMCSFLNIALTLIFSNYYESRELLNFCLLEEAKVIPVCATIIDISTQSSLFYISSFNNGNHLT